MSLSKVSKVSLATGDNVVYGMVLDYAGGYLYGVCNTSPGRCFRIRLSDFTHQGTITFNSGENSARGIALDRVNGYLYCTCYVSPTKVVRIRLSDFTYVDCLTMPASHANGHGIIVSTVLGYLYVGNYAPTYTCDRVLLSSFSYVDYVNFGSGRLAYNDSARVDVATLIGMMCTYTTIRAVKIDLSTFSVLGETTLLGGGYIVSAGVDDVHGYFFAVDGQNPARVNRIVESSWTCDSSLTLNSGYGSATCMAVNGAGSIGYVGHGVTPLRVSRVDLYPLAWRDGFIGASGDNVAQSIVLDEYGGFVYVGLNMNPGAVVKYSDGDLIPPGGPQMLPLVGVG